VKLKESRPMRKGSGKRRRCSKTAMTARGRGATRGSLAIGRAGKRNARNRGRDGREEATGNGGKEKRHPLFFFWGAGREMGGRGDGEGPLTKRKERGGEN